MHCIDIRGVYKTLTQARPSRPHHNLMHCIDIRGVYKTLTQARPSRPHHKVMHCIDIRGVYKTLTQARPSRPHHNVMHCIDIRGVSTAMISPLHSIIHAAKMEINPPKTACGYPCDGGNDRTTAQAILSPYGLPLTYTRSNSPANRHMQGSMHAMFSKIIDL